MGVLNWTLKTIRDRCEEVGDCWVWGQAVNSTGYPQATIGGKGGQPVRRVSVVLSGRRVGKGWRVVSDCGKLCCNPEHLKLKTFSQVLVTSYESGRRNSAADYLGRFRRAQQAGMAQLTVEQVREIRGKLWAGATGASLAREYGVGHRCIREIKLNRSWRMPTAYPAMEAA